MDKCMNCGRTIPKDEICKSGVICQKCPIGNKPPDGLQSENKQLKEQIKGYGELLGSVNHDVEQLTKYTDDLQAENKQKDIAIQVARDFISGRKGVCSAEAAVDTLEAIAQALKGEPK